MLFRSTTLVASTPATTFNDELIDTSRLPLDIVIESLTGQLGRGEEDPGVISQISEHLDR